MKACVDSLAQLVEHSTFNAGVLGSSPRRITETRDDRNVIPFFISVIASIFPLNPPLGKGDFSLTLSVVSTAAYSVFCIHFWLGLEPSLPPFKGAEGL